MLRIGLVVLEKGVGSDRIESDGKWEAVQLFNKGANMKMFKAQPRTEALDAFAILGADESKVRYVREAFSLGKHVMADFPAGRNQQEVLKLRDLACSSCLRFHSPNLLKSEPGMAEFKRKAEDPTSKLASLTVSCSMSARGKNAFWMKLTQLVDWVEWMAGTKCVELRSQKSAKTGSNFAQVVLLTHENGVKTLLNVHSAAEVDYPRLWVDAIFDTSIMHLEPTAQTVLVDRFGGSTGRVNWAEPAVNRALNEFVSLIESGSDRSELSGSDRVIELSRKLA